MYEYLCCPCSYVFLCFLLPIFVCISIANFGINGAFHVINCQTNVSFHSSLFSLPDISKTFLPEPNLIVKVHPNEAFTVPCRLSNPKYNIRYTTIYTTGGFYRDLGKNRTVTYDPRIGYTFGVHSGGQIIPNLNILCWTDHDQTELYVLLYVGGK